MKTAKTFDVIFWVVICALWIACGVFYFAFLSVANPFCFSFVFLGVIIFILPPVIIGLSYYLFNK